jgi:hypothetical protein
VAKFLRAIQKASKWVQENPDETARIITGKKYVAGEVATNARVLKTFNYRASVSQALSAIERNAKELQQIGLVAADVDVNALVKNTFAEVPGVPDSLFKSPARPLRDCDCNWRFVRHCSKKECGLVQEPMFPARSDVKKVIAAGFAWAGGYGPFILRENVITVLIVMNLRHCLCIFLQFFRVRGESFYCMKCFYLGIKFV